MTRKLNKQIIINWIEKEGNSRELLAALIGRSTSYLDKLLSGKLPLPQIELGQKMANVLGVNFDVLFELVEEKSAA